MDASKAAFALGRLLECQASILEHASSGSETNNVKPPKQRDKPTMTAATVANQKGENRARGNETNGNVRVGGEDPGQALAKQAGTQQQPLQAQNRAPRNRVPNKQQSIASEIAFALSLDLDRRIDDKRPNRSTGDGSINIVERKRFLPIEKLQVMNLAEWWEYRDWSKVTKQRQEIARPACKLVAYDCGMERAPDGTTVSTWIETWESTLRGKTKIHSQRRFVRQEGR